VTAFYDDFHSLELSNFLVIFPVQMHIIPNSNFSSSVYSWILEPFAIVQNVHVLIRDEHTERYRCMRTMHNACFCQGNHVMDVYTIMKELRRNISTTLALIA